MITKNDFVNSDDSLLATVPSAFPQPVGLPYNGDYDHLVAVEKNFYGIFSANNTPDLANFPNGVKYQRVANFNSRKLFDLDGNEIGASIDPFFFKLTE